VVGPKYKEEGQTTFDWRRIMRCPNCDMETVQEYCVECADWHDRLIDPLADWLLDPQNQCEIHIGLYEDIEEAENQEEEER
jgi:hypothetical protein